MWEYDRIEFSFKKTSELKSKLNELGCNNWEIISYNETSPSEYGKESKSIIMVKRLIKKDKIFL